VGPGAEGVDEGTVGGAKLHLGGIVGGVDERGGAAVRGRGLAVRSLVKKSATPSLNRT
jgi:hypothetical protein